MTNIYVCTGRRRRRGFSLLELMVAMTILAIALVPVAYFYTKSLQMIEETTVASRALTLAQERIAEVKKIPYDRLLSNITPTEEQLKVFTIDGPIDVTTDDWYGYDYESWNEWQAMYRYPLPLDFNPYQPQTQGYNNAPGTNHTQNNIPLAGGVMSDPHINFNDGGAPPAFMYYEYEPIGFYRYKVFNRNARLGAVDQRDIRMSDPRTITTVEPSLQDGVDWFRDGSEQDVDNFEVYGRRTVILDLVPKPQDTDPALGAPDNYEPTDELDGGANAFNLFPLGKGPDNKFQMASPFGTEGKLVIVEVFWLPRNAPEAYIPREELNIVQLRAFVNPDNEWTMQSPMLNSRLGSLDTSMFNITAP